jgi:hypothetical protein
MLYQLSHIRMSFRPPFGLPRNEIKLYTTVSAHAKSCGHDPDHRDAEGWAFNAQDLIDRPPDSRETTTVDQ